MIISLIIYIITTMCLPRFVDSNYPVNSIRACEVHPLTTKFRLEYNPLKSRIVVRRLAVPIRDARFSNLSS